MAALIGYESNIVRDSNALYIATSVEGLKAQSRTRSREDIIAGACRRISRMERPSHAGVKP